MQITQLTENDATDNSRTTQNQQQDSSKVCAQARNGLHKRFDIAIGRIGAR